MTVAAQGHSHPKMIIDRATSLPYSSHIAAIVLTHGGRVLACDHRGRSFLKAGNVMRLSGGQLCCTDESCQPRFSSALKKMADTGRTASLLVRALEQPGQRFSLTLTRILQRPPPAIDDGEPHVPAVLCLAAPLDRRRVATAQQLMDLFSLSAAEARLARALCHGDSVKEYARDQGLQLPTVRSQLSSALNKTGSKGQAALVGLIAGIPAVRDSV